MQKFIKTEFIKEKKSANFKLVKIVPLIFVIFTSFVSLFMVPATNAQSYLFAAAFNWYPLLILPIVLSLLVANITSKEKIYQKNLYKSLGIDAGKMTWAKAVVVLAHLLVILLLSTLLLFLVGRFVLGDSINFMETLKASILTFIGSMPIIGLSFLLMVLFNKGFVVILINFILSIVSPLVAVNDLWLAFPHSYSLRMLASAAHIHPNGTFLEAGSPLLNPNSIYVGVALSVGVFVLALILASVVSKRMQDD